MLLIYDDVSVAGALACLNCRDVLAIAQVLLDGNLVAKSSRDAGSSLVFYAPSASGVKGASAEVSIVVEAVGRSNGGCDWDFKGLQSDNVTLNGALATTPLELLASREGNGNGTYFRCCPYRCTPR